MTRSTLSEVTPVNILRAEVIGLEREVSLIGGVRRTYIHLDHAACTPAFRSVIEKMAACLEWYGDAQHGYGHRALASQKIYAQALATALNFVGADAQADTVYYGKNTSEVLEVLSRCIRWEPGDVVLATELNALSTPMPWWGKAQVVCAGLDERGRFDLEDLKNKLVRFAGRVKLVTVNGAEAITGAVPPIHAAAELAHTFRALVLAECGQVAAHRAIQKGRPGSKGQLDFLTLSGQKMYAPVGIAALVGGKQHLQKVIENYGTPNLAGAAALAASMTVLMESGLDAIAAHEAQLSQTAQAALRRIPGCLIAGDEEPGRIEDTLGYLSFGMQGISSARLAAILAYEAGVGVGANLESSLARASFGCYNDTSDVDRLVEGLERIARGEILAEYVSGADGRYLPRGFSPLGENDRMIS